jgi:hypothetical protein
MTEPKITTETLPNGTVLESWPLGASVLAMKDIPFSDRAESDYIVRERDPKPTQAEQVSWKNEDAETPSGPVYVDGAPWQEISFDQGENWSCDWFPLTQARRRARDLHAEFGES